ncbi:MAG: PIN domain-containing protein [Ruminococcaceae bacterium]|nr:PIN domain-containing protein [Oscillospiraceae bacterium]
MRVLIDTNILLDFFFDREPYNVYADRVLKMCGNYELQGFIAAISIPNAFYILRKDHPADERRKMLLDICGFLSIVGIDSAKIWGALINSEFTDFEDCLQDECAVACGADYIITRNIKDFAHSTVPPITAEDFLKLIDKQRIV